MATASSTFLVLFVTYGVISGSGPLDGPSKTPLKNHEVVHSSQGANVAGYTGLLGEYLLTLRSSVVAALATSGHEGIPVKGFSIDNAEAYPTRINCFTNMGLDGEIKISSEGRVLQMSLDWNMMTVKWDGKFRKSWFGSPRTFGIRAHVHVSTNEFNALYDNSSKIFQIQDSTELNIHYELISTESWGDDINDIREKIQDHVSEALDKALHDQESVLKTVINEALTSLQCPPDLCWMKTSDIPVWQYRL